jgi:hypothetical protein
MAVDHFQNNVDPNSHHLQIPRQPEPTIPPNSPLILNPVRKGYQL